MTETSPGAVESLEIRAAAAERLTFFADAVVAIAITLLALELPVPEGTTNAEVLRSVAENREEYIAFLVSFSVIGAHWRAHHRVFRYVETLGGHLAWLTLMWLLMQVITPFATRVLTEDGAFQVRFIFYATVQALADLIFLLMIREIRRHRLFRADTPPRLLAGVTVRSATLAAGFLISIPLAFTGRVAYLSWALIPLIGGVIRRAYFRRAEID